jgi:hypothetical protein
MKNTIIKSTAKLFLFVTSVFMIGLSTSYAQIGPSPAATNTPNYGIYGSAPTPASTPFTCGTPRYAKIETYPVAVGDETAFTQVVPLNGLKNFNFYYTADQTGFLSGGGYKVTYLSASQTNCYGIGNIVTYSPNRAHTNGVQVRPFNLGGYTTPRGIHGIILAKIPGGGGATAPLENATASVGSASLFKAKTNGVGYFSIYYSNHGPDGFLPNEDAYYTHISGVYNNCPYTWDDDLGSIWVLSGGPDDPEYYVQGAESDIGTKTLESQAPGCQP